MTGCREPPEPGPVVVEHNLTTKIFRNFGAEKGDVCRSSRASPFYLATCVAKILSSPVDGCGIYAKASTNSSLTSVVRISEHLSLESGTDANALGRIHD